MLKKVDVVKKTIKVFDTLELKVGDAYIMTVGNDGLEIDGCVLLAEEEVFVLIERFNENEIKVACIPHQAIDKGVQRFTITPDMDVTLERVIVW